MAEERQQETGAKVFRHDRVPDRREQPGGSGQYEYTQPFHGRSGQIPGGKQKRGGSRFPRARTHKNLFQPKNFHGQHPDVKKRAYLAGHGAGGGDQALFCPVPALWAVHRTEIRLPEMAQQGRRTGEHRPGRNGRVCVPSMRGRDYGSGQGENAAGWPLAGCEATDEEPQKRGLLAEHPVFPVHPFFRYCAGVHAEQRRPGTAAQLHQQLAGGAMGGHEAENQRGVGHGATDGNTGVDAAAMDEANYRRDRRTGKLPVLDDPRMGRLHDQPERGPRAGAFYGRGGKGHERGVFTAKRRHGHGQPGPDGQRRPDRRSLRVLRHQFGLGAAMQGHQHHAVPLPPFRGQ